MRIAVTGAYGFSGKYIARRLLDLKHDVITLTNSPHRGNPFGEALKAFPYNFSKPHELENLLRGTFRYRGLVEMIAREIDSRALIVPMSPMLAFQGVRVLGWMVRDVINTRDEVKGLMQERLYVDSPPLGTTKLSDWVRAHREKIGRQYASELQRRFDRVSAYQPID